MNTLHFSPRIKDETPAIGATAQPLGGREGGRTSPPKKNWTDHPNFFDEECDYRYVTNCSARNWVCHPYFVLYNNLEQEIGPPTLKTWLRPWIGGYPLQNFLSADLWIFHRFTGHSDGPGRRVRTPGLPGQLRPLLSHTHFPPFSGFYFPILLLLFSLVIACSLFSDNNCCFSFSLTNRLFEGATIFVFDNLKT